MGAVDPKDMTASELLRSGNSICGLCMILTYGDCMKQDCLNILTALADKIDAELAEARNESLRQGAMVWAKANGWPDFRDGEDFGTWLDRCAFPKPMDEHGEPVQLGEHIDDKVRGGIDVSRISYTANGHYFNNSHNSVGTRIAKRITYAPGERVKRPAPEALGADGLPVVEGETVWLADEYARYAGICYYDSGCLCGLAGIYANDAFKIKLIVSERKVVLDTYSDAWCPASWLTHTPPDTQRQIDEDVAKSTFEYWGCLNTRCGNCPALVGGEKPWARLGTEDCQEAMVSDLLRRQRELDARNGGE